MRIPQVDSMNILSSSIVPSGCTMVCVEEQLLKATGRIWELAGIFTSKDVPNSVKFAKYVERILPIALYNAGCWVWNGALQARLGACENLTLRRMIGLRRRTDETWLALHKRTIRVARRLYYRNGHESISVRALYRSCKVLAPYIVLRFRAMTKRFCRGHLDSNFVPPYGVKRPQTFIIIVCFTYVLQAFSVDTVWHVRIGVGTE